MESSSGEVTARRSALRRREEPVQLTIDSTDGHVLQKLREMDVNAMTPMQCMNMLFELNSMLKS